MSRSNGEGAAKALLNVRRPLMLMYHSIAEPPENPNDLWVSPKTFEAQMNVLKARGLRGVSLRELREGDARKLVGLTFDDGYVDFLGDAAPILEKFGFSGTVFVVAGLIGSENDWAHHLQPRPRVRLLGEKGLREAARRGMEVASHGMTHGAMAGMAPESLEEEAGESRSILGEILGEQVEGFCYPYGSVDLRAAQAVRNAGYSYACSVTERPERTDYDLPRVGVSDRDNPLRFFAKMAFHRSAPGRRKDYRGAPAVPFARS